MTVEQLVWAKFGAALFTTLFWGGCLMLTVILVIAFWCWRIGFLPGFGQAGPSGATTMKDDGE